MVIFSNLMIRMRKTHGEHNEILSDYLLNFENGKFNDWVITTAFYACIHFVEHKLFPCKMDGVNYETFEDYCTYKYNAYNNRSKHFLKSELVKYRIPAIDHQYRFLKDTCMNVRYYEFRVTNNKAKTCNEIMKVIKMLCMT